MSLHELGETFLGYFECFVLITSPSVLVIIIINTLYFLYPPVSNPLGWCLESLQFPFPYCFIHSWLLRLEDTFPYFWNLVPSQPFHLWPDFLFCHSLIFVTILALPTYLRTCNLQTYVWEKIRKRKLITLFFNILTRLII